MKVTIYKPPYAVGTRNGKYYVNVYAKVTVNEPKVKYVRFYLARGDTYREFVFDQPGTQEDVFQLTEVVTEKETVACNFENIPAGETRQVPAGKVVIIDAGGKIRYMGAEYVPSVPVLLLQDVEVVGPASLCDAQVETIDEDLVVWVRDTQGYQYAEYREPLKLLAKDYEFKSDVEVLASVW